MATHSSVLARRIPGMEAWWAAVIWGRTESDMTEVTQQQDTVVMWKAIFLDLRKKQGFPKNYKSFEFQGSSKKIIVIP